MKVKPAMALDNLIHPYLKKTKQKATFSSSAKNVDTDEKR